MEKVKDIKSPLKGEGIKINTMRFVAHTIFLGAKQDNNFKKSFI